MRFQAAAPPNPFIGNQKMYLITITVNPDLSAEQHETLFPKHAE